MIKKLFNIFLVFLAVAFFILASNKVFIKKAYASILFVDEFNGTGELSAYNNYYERVNPQSLGTFILDSDHLYTSGFDPEYIYTGVSSDHTCASIDFNWSLGGDWTAIILHANPSDSSNNPIQFFIERPGRIPGVEWVLNGGNGIITELSGQANFDVNQTHTLKACTRGDMIEGYLDDNLLVTVPDNLELGGYNGFRSQFPTEYLDNFKIESVDSSTDLAVVLLKQTSSPWGAETYDGANNWFPTGPTISRWGCALTSATMILNYHGYNFLPGNIPLNPGTLNDWLKSQPDGYIDGVTSGYINWLAISRLSKIAKETNGITGFDALEYKHFSGGNTAQLTSDISNNIPDILEETGHFIVAKGVNGNTFDINDPFYNRTDLTNGYANTFLSLGEYKPSFTDLSYMLFTVSNGIGVQVKDSLGNNITTNSFLQQPLFDPIDNLNAGQPVTFVLVPKPILGNYQINLTGTTSQIYKLNSYFYGVDGNVKIFNQQGTVGLGANDSLQVFFDNQNSNSSTQTKIVTFMSAANDVNAAQDLNLIKGGGGLLADLKNAQKAYQQGDISNEKTRLNQFIDHINQQRGKGVSEIVYQILLYDANYLISHA